MADNQNNPSPEEKKEEFSKIVLETQTEDFASSTVFAAPAEHNDKKKAGKFSLLKKIIAAVLVVAILVGSTVLVVKLIPELTEEKAEIFEPKQVMVLDTSTFKKVTVKHSGITLVLNSAIEEKNNESKQVWTLEGYDPTLIDATSLSQIASYAASVTAYGEYDYTEEDAEKYGFNEGALVVDVETSDKVMGNFTLTVGNATADSQYCYLHISSVPKKVYLVNRGTMTGFLVEPLDLAISTAIPAVEKNDKNKGYFDTEGKLADFDTITISGSRFKTPLVFTPNKNEKFSSYATYICTSPKVRIADGVIEEIRDSFGNGVAASGVVSFDQSAESIKKFGLDKPDLVFTIKVAGQNYSYKLKATDASETQYYILASTDRLIRTVTISNMSYLSNEEKDYYLGFMALEAIGDVSEFILKGDVNAAFTIAKNEENEDGAYTVKCGDKAVKSEDFQNFYAVFMGTTALDYNTVKVSGSPDLTVTMKHHDGSAPTVLTFYKVSESRYQYSVGGIPMGQIASSAYSKFVREIGKLAE